MASSRKSRKPNKADAGIDAAFERALEAILARVVASGGDALALAYSGGLDSTVLLHLAGAHCSAHGMRLHAFHVHHGLSPNADAWLAHCEREARAAGASFAARHVDVANADEHGTEQAARLARYAALGALCREHGIRLLLTAHHQDDQAETVLLQLLRGAGLPGLSGMAALHEGHGLLGGVTLGRPLLQLSRRDLERYATQHGLHAVEDESNADTRYRRNAIRRLVAPVIEENFPGFAARLARSAQHAQSAQRLLDEFAALDLAACEKDGALDVARLAGLSQDRVDNLLRHWLQRQGCRLPGNAQLEQLRARVLGAGSNAHPWLELDGFRFERHGGLLRIAPDPPHGDPPVEAIALRWHGEDRIFVPQWHGGLAFERTDGPGLDPALLAGSSLQLKPRSGAERLKLDVDRPSRTLKNLFQEAAIPARQRPWLPLLYVGGELAFAAGLGMDVRLQKPGLGIRLRWLTD